MINSIKMYYTILICIVFCNVNVVKASNNISSAEIHVQKLTMKIPADNQYFSEILLQGEIAETEVIHNILAGPLSFLETSSNTEDHIFLFIKGEGTLLAGEEKYQIEQESIAVPFLENNITINVAEGDTLHYLKVIKIISEKDFEDVKAFPVENRNKIYFKKYKECEAYTEKIKSPNTVSRTVLPKDFVPRTAMGTVETIGPDEVGAHEHPMLDQLFLGLAGNDVTVHADDKSVHFTEFSILHIPIGSSHWVTVDEGKNMYYQWMDFFLTKEGEEWLKTHKKIDEYNKK